MKTVNRCVLTKCCQPMSRIAENAGLQVRFDVRASIFLVCARAHDQVALRLYDRVFEMVNQNLV